MKTNQFITVFTAVLLAAVVAGCSTSQEKQASLAAKARVSKADAERTALSKAAAGGKVESSELEEEKGRLVWSFDIATPGTKDITEVLVDAKTGEVVSVDNETPEQQAKEKEEDAKKEKH